MNIICFVYYDGWITKTSKKFHPTFILNKTNDIIHMLDEQISVVLVLCNNTLC